MAFSYENVYQQHFTDAFNTIKQYRDSWDHSIRATLEGPKTEYCKLWTSDEYTFNYVIKKSDDITRDVLVRMFAKMMIHRDPSSKVIHIIKNEYNEYSECNSNITFEELKPSKLEYQAVATNVQNKKILFIFKEYGIANRLPHEILKQVIEEHELHGYVYISLVDTYAYTEVINHKDDELNASRGTNIYSLPFFFQILFSSDEFAVFEKYYLKYRESLSAYFGLSIVKSLRPNVLFSYRKHVRNTLSTFDYLGTLSHFTERELSEEQKSIIDSQFLNKGFLCALTSLRPYSKCFLTAEWLYASLRDSSDSIDLTVISMGYFKSLEQFFYQYIGQHTSDKDGKRREYAFKDNEWFKLTDDNYTSRKKEMILGGLAKFLKNRNNRDLFGEFINQNTYDVIRDVLSNVTAQRNGYFHKDNITAWAEIEKARNTTILIFYFLLGTLRISDSDKKPLGIDDSFCPSAAEKTCIYIHNLSIRNNPFNIPILYLSKNAAKEDFWYPCQDRNVEYNEFGNPKHSGIYYRRMHDDENQAVYCSKGELPASIFEGILHVSSQLIRSYTLSGPIRQIWGDNTYLIQ